MDESLTQDLVALWQSELTAMAADRELRESFGTLVTLWATTVSTVHDNAFGSAWPAQPPRPTAAAAAPDAGGGAAAERDELGRRLAELERRLGQLEKGDR